MGLKQGFDRFDHTLKRMRIGSAKVTDRAIAVVDEHLRKRPSQPLFLWIHYYDPHHPYEIRSRYRFGSPDRDEDRYDGEVAATDHDIGRLLVYLRVAGIYDDTAILVTADHGEAFNEHGKRFHSGTLYNEMIHIPLIFKAKGLAPSISNVPCGTVDFAPTLLSLVPEFQDWQNLMGRSLIDLNRSQDLPTFATLDFLREYHAPERMIIPSPGRMKLIADLDNGLFEYYDLEKDPWERNNLADERRDEVDALLPKLEAWFEWVVKDGTL